MTIRGESSDRGETLPERRQSSSALMRQAKRSAVKPANEKVKPLAKRRASWENFWRDTFARLFQLGFHLD
jgi:hypothetical protein